MSIYGKSIAIAPIRQKPAVLGTITLSTSWSGSDPYTQTVSITDATANSYFEIQPTNDQLIQLIIDGVAILRLDNDNGTVMATAVGGCPSTAMTINYIKTEVVQ